MTRNNEEQILRRTVAALLAMPGVKGIDVDDGGEEFALQDSTDVEAIVEACFAVDDCGLIARDGSETTEWVGFIWNNGNDGWDAMYDYTVGLEDTLKLVFYWIDEMEGADQ